MSITLNDVTELASISLEQALKEKYPSAQPWDLPGSASWYLYSRYIASIFNLHCPCLFEVDL